VRRVPVYFIPAVGLCTWSLLYFTCFSSPRNSVSGYASVGMWCLWPWVVVVFLAWCWQPSSLSAKLSELASRRADWLSSVTIGNHQPQRKSCRSLETVIGASEIERDASLEQYSSPLHRSASSSALSSPVAAESVSSYVTQPVYWQ